MMSVVQRGLHSGSPHGKENGDAKVWSAIGRNERGK